MSAALHTPVGRGFAERVAHAAVIFIDGRSGSGKTHLARELARELHAGGLPEPQLLGMDYLYPGWDGLAAGSAALAGVLREGSYRPYDWHAGTFTEPIALDRERTLIVEGCGALSHAALAAAASWGASYTIWLESPAELRRERALARDGDMFAPHWTEWARQEEALFARTQPRAIAREIRHAVGSSCPQAL